ncbi:AAA family ATPase [Nonomuraea candida]|uniref:AAA family ATPase n=1 Tax=Nonomuraea candida TaxID=359159 RepID=UPI0009FE007D|nr:AAA family ATPase [Nonomuraea candida]
MLLLTHAKRKAKSAGAPIPVVWQTLADNTVHFRRSQVAMVAAAPGVGKSAYTLNLAIRSGAHGIYMSADSDEVTQAIRAAAILTGDRVQDIEAAYKQEKGAKYDKALKEFTRVWFDFDAAPSLKAIEEEVLAYAYMYGKWPELLVLDNLANVFDESGGEGFTSLESTMSFLVDLARKTEAAVVVLHHVVGDAESGDQPLKLKDIRGKITKLQTLVLGLAYTDTFTPQGRALGVYVLKNRSGKASAAGDLMIELNADLDRMLINDMEQGGGVPDDVWEEFKTAVEAEGAPERRIYEEM